jgi:hypothetical protein
MALSFTLAGSVPAKLANKEIDFDTNTIRLMLLGAGYTPDQDTHDYIDDVSAQEVAATGNYVAGGQALANKTVGYTAGTNTTKFDADDVTWANSTITASYGALYCDTGTPATSAIIGIVDLGGSKSSSNGPFTVAWNVDGIFTGVV